jgi:hypothetical protein
MSKKEKKKEKDELLKNKNEELPTLKEVIEFDDEETKLIQDIPSEKVNKK